MKYLKAIKDWTSAAIVVVVCAACIIVVIYGAYWVAKSFSYAFFYEDMVQRTVVEMVKPEYLK